VRIAYHDSIAAGWPLLFALDRPLHRGEIVGIRAVLSSTCNVVLERMEQGATLEEGLAAAAAHGYPEVDPSLDLSGWDSAQKLALLLTRAVRRRYTTDGMEIVGIENLGPEIVRSAVEFGMRVKLVAYARLDGETPLATVRPMAVPAESHLGSVRDARNVVVLESRSEGELVHMGPGFGTLPVARAVLNDLIGVMDPRHSWTGRFPGTADSPLGAPIFTRFLVVQAGEATIEATPGPDRIPVLRP
jgi:homoserine dehydrogenase